MKLLMFAVKDRATEMFGNPMFLVSAGQAMRSFSDEVNRADPQNQLHAHPEDFDLYALGEFDTNTGDFQVGRPEKIAEARNLVIKNGGAK